MLKYIIILSLLLVLPLSAQQKEEGKLGEFEDEVTGETQEDDDDEEWAAIVIESMDECEDCGPILLDGFIHFIEFMIYSEQFDQSFSNNQYSPYPYFNHHAGLYGEATGKSFSIMLNSHYFHHSDQLNGFIFNANFSPIPVLSIQIDYTDLTETLRTRYDHLRIYNLFLKYNRIRYEVFSLYWGIGLKGIKGDSYTSAFAFTSGLEFFPVKPVSFSVNYSVGLFPLARVDEYGAGVNLHSGRWRFQIGYKNYRSGRVNIGGLMMGIGLYF